MFDGDSTHSSSQTGYAEAEAPFQWMVVLGKLYGLREIRFRLLEVHNRFYRYRLFVSADGKTFAPVADRSQGEWRGWQTIIFPLRPVKFIKIDALLWQRQLVYGRKIRGLLRAGQQPGAEVRSR